MSSIGKKIGLILGPLAFLIILLFVSSAQLSQRAVAVLAGTAWIAIWWITEAIPIAATSLLPIVLFPLTGGLDIGETTSSYGHRYVFLYIGGFILAIAIEKWDLHRRIALTVINIVGTNVNRIVLGFMIATAFLSMWISNTATSIMMLPIALAIVYQLSDNPKTDENENLIFGKMLMLAIAYSASIGGIATLIGTPPNLVLAGILDSLYNVEITFTQWIVLGLPTSMVLLLICWKYLTNFAFNIRQKEFPGGRQEIKQQLALLGKISYEEKLVLVVFALTAFAWISRSFLIEKLLPGTDDTIIAIAAAVALFIIPASKEKGRPLLTWEEAVRIPWGILLLFGGGLAIATGFKDTGLAEWIGNQLTLLEGVSNIVLLLILIAAINFLTEITSNLATTAMMLPILAPLALGLNVHPYLLMIGTTLAASCAFMLPVATPPNAVVFGSGYLKIIDMVKVGIVMNVISILIITVVIYFALHHLWGFDPYVFPEQFKISR
ncbi:SLC13 family permease [Portibacter marinus]|uniref:SLC13 family permease n=1 Tax=Portibacter marinus TaxID=2898660 RepID=UPI001F158E47|nr:SLC13 family permease [Portibacter marinus]